MNPRQADLSPESVAFARKADKFYANLRTTCNLFLHSKWPTETQARNLINELSDNLAKGTLIYPPTLNQFGITQDTPYRQRRLYLGLNPTVKFYSEGDTQKRLDEFDQHMVLCKSDSRRRDWQWRVSQHAEEMQEKGWYPFFVTLTVDPKLNDPAAVWAPESKAFRNYITSLCNVVTGVMGHPRCNKPPYKSQSDYITYVGAIEHGKSREHHHGHFLIWMRDIPSHWKIDPNKGRLPGYRTARACTPLQSYWPYATHAEAGKPLYFRSKGDIWSTKHDFCHPLEEAHGAPVKIRGVKAAGHYITKYLKKDHKEWQHRMKATRNLGMYSLKTKLNTLTTEQLEALAWRAPTSSLLHSVSSIHSVPSALLRREAKQLHFWRSFLSNQLDLKTLMNRSSYGFQRMQQSVRNGARPSRMPSLECYDWLSQHLDAQIGFCETRFLEAHQLLSEQFPKDRIRVQHQILGANDIGSTSGLQDRRPPNRSGGEKVH